MPAQRNHLPRGGVNLTSAAGVDDGGGHQVALRDGRDGRSRPSGASTPTSGYGLGCVPCRCALLSANGTDSYIPDSNPWTRTRRSPSERSERATQPRCFRSVLCRKGVGSSESTETRRPGNFRGVANRDTSRMCVRKWSYRSRRMCCRPPVGGVGLQGQASITCGPLACVDFYHFQEENAGTRCSRRPLFPLMVRTIRHMDLVHLKLFWGASSTPTYITKFVYNTSPKILLQTHFQENIQVRNKAEDLIPRVDAMEKHFDSHPSDVAELRRRDEVILYAIIRPTVLGAEFFPVSSRTSRNGFGCCAESRGRSNPLTTFRTMETC